MHFLRQGLNDLFAIRMMRMFMVSKTNRTQSKELLLESGIVNHARKPLLAVLGLFQRQLLPQSAGRFYCVLDSRMKADMFSFLSFSTVRRLRELTEA